MAPPTFPSDVFSFTAHVIYWTYVVADVEVGLIVAMVMARELPPGLMPTTMTKGFILRDVVFAAMPAGHPRRRPTGGGAIAASGNVSVASPSRVRRAPPQLRAQAQGLPWMRSPLYLCRRPPCRRKGKSRKGHLP